MGLFSKASNQLATIRVHDILVHFDARSTNWSFCYRDVDFVTHGSALVMPSREALDGMLAHIERLRPAMVERLVKGWAHEPLAKVNDGETFHICLESYGDDGAYEASWSGGATWGDMGVDFVVHNGEIIGESWGD